MPKRDEELDSRHPSGLLTNEPEFTYIQDTPVPEFMDNFPGKRPILYMRCNPGIPKGRDEPGDPANPSSPRASSTPASLLTTGTRSPCLLKTPDKGFSDPKAADFAGKVPNNPTAEPEVFGYSSPARPARCSRNANGYMLIQHERPNRRFGDGDDIIYGSGGGQWILNPRTPGRRSGFTLVELLVTIGIILVLLGILMPSILAMRRAADRKRTEMDFQTIKRRRSRRTSRSSTTTPGRSGPTGMSASPPRATTGPRAGAGQVPAGMGSVAPGK